MRRFLFTALVAVMCLPTLSMAQDRVRLGYGHLITNDILGDGRDRWRSGGAQSSRVWGPQWAGVAPVQFGQLLELRLGAEVISPQNIRRPDASDRRYAGAFSVGVHTHAQRGAVEWAVGADLVFVGPQTRLDEFQDALHDTLNIKRPSDAVRDAQIGNSIKPTLVFELGQTFDLGSGARVRPFVEGRAGVETMLRAGADLTIGALGQGELLVRDSVSGHRYRAIAGDWSGAAFVLGADVARVEDSTFLPEGGAAVLSPTRERVRAGVMWQGESGVSGFYGVTYLGEEFEGQSEGQFVGSFRVRINF